MPGENNAHQNLGSNTWTHRDGCRRQQAIGRRRDRAGGCSSGASTLRPAPRQQRVARAPKAVDARVDTIERHVDDGQRVVVWVNNQVSHGGAAFKMDETESSATFSSADVDTACARRARCRNGLLGWATGRKAPATFEAAARLAGLSGLFDSTRNPLIRLQFSADALSKSYV